VTYLDRYHDALMNTFGPPRLALVRGEGAHVWDEAGREYVDLFGGIAVNALGHAHPALVDAVTSQLKTLGHVSNFFATPPQVELAERLLALAGGREGRVFFSNSGTEANEAAFKLTRQTGRTHVVAAEGAFHGRTMGALALTHKAAYREPFEPLPGHVTWVPYGDAEALAAAVTDQTAAVVLEPVQGEAGVVVPPEGYLAAARAVTRDRGALLWVDEVQSGVGRTGEWFAHETDLAPDVITLAKGLGGGIPVGATVALGDAATLLGPGNHGTTFGGNPVACAAALAVLDTIEKEGLLEAVVTRGAQLTAALRSAAEVTAVEGRGLLLGAQLADETAAAVVQRAQEQGWLLNNTGPARLRFAPPLTLTESDVAAFAAAWPAIVTEPGAAS
jgi:acetylornithine/N-succinyldiaminopimelate aminotransferase